MHAGGWRIPVDGVLPFSGSPRNGFGEPRGLGPIPLVRTKRFFTACDSGKFNGVYLPFWTYDAMTANAYLGQRGEYYWETEGTGDNKRQVRRTRWWPASGQFQRFFDDVLVSAGRGIRRELVDGLQPWPLERCMPFAPEVMAGFMARTYDVELEEGFSQGASSNPSPQSSRKSASGSAATSKRSTISGRDTAP